MNILNSISWRKNDFWFFQISGWLVYGVIDLYAESQMTGPYEMNYKLLIAWFLSLLTGFAISLLLRILYKSIYTTNRSIVTFSSISFFCAVVGSLLWLSVKDITENGLQLGMPYSIWSAWAEPGFFDYLIVNMMTLTIPLFAWSFIYFGYKLKENISSEKEKNEESLLLAKEAQLQMLRYQINPHFLFNSLSSIQALMYKDTPLADEILGEFSEFLRYTLKNKDKIYVPLEEEIDMISRYLYIEKIRFQEKLSYDIDVTTDTRKIKILSFLIQPFVENAIKYGLKEKQDVLKINLRSYKKNNWLIIAIDNSGKWINNNTKQGIGIENVMNRLNNAYPDKHILDIAEDNKWVKVKLQIHLPNE